MRLFFKFFIAPVASLIAWAALIYSATINGWFHSPVAPTNDAAAFTVAATRTIDNASKGNAALLVLENGKITGEHYVSAGTPVNQDTLFQVASLSKWVSAWGVMTLVDKGMLDLDVPVSRYLTRWQLPDSEFDNDGVTVRRLLSHTAGLTDGLGYGGFASLNEVQSIEASLTKAVDASPNADGRVLVGIEPGTAFKYSGGGYTLLQLLIEEVSGKSFEQYMQEAVFQPLGMHRTTYEQVDETTKNLAEFYDMEGDLAQHYRFAGLAPTSLYTSAGDMARFIQAHLDQGPNAPIGRHSLKAETVAMMRVPHATSFGADIWGLGAMLFAPTPNGDFIIGHDGKNEPAINTSARLNPENGDGFILLETGNELLATETAGEWTFLQTGQLDLLMFTVAKDTMVQIILAGWLIIIFFSLGLGCRSWRNRHSK
tara:strand:+ start:28 stop:1308 length:1281 start_codon:yes stop_codon:yes gene_type:complete